MLIIRNFKFIGAALISLLVLLISCDADEQVGSIEIIAPDSSLPIEGQDDNKNEVEVVTLEGTWVMTDLLFDETTDNDQLEFSKEIITNLKAEDCYLYSYEFGASNTITTTSKINHIEINNGPSGLEISCPMDQDTENLTYSIEENLLTLLEDSAERSVEITFNGDTEFRISGDFIDENNYGGGELVFVKIQP